MSMGTEHKKALVIIFAFLFSCLLAGTVIIAMHTQHLAIAGILLVAAIILAIDIYWVLRQQHEPQLQAISIKNKP